MPVKLISWISGVRIVVGFSVEWRWFLYGVRARLGGNGEFFVVMMLEMCNIIKHKYIMMQSK